MDHTDHSVRMAAFRFLEEQMRLAGEDGALRRTLLEQGFTYDGQRVPLLGPQGIFKPRILRSIPLSITTVPAIERQSRPYDDAFGEDRASTGPGYSCRTGRSAGQINDCWRSDMSDFGRQSGDGARTLSRPDGRLNVVRVWRSGRSRSSSRSRRILGESR